MKVCLNMIADRLTEELYMLPEAGNREVSDALPYNSADECMENTLYIVNGSELSESPVVAQSRNMLYVLPSVTVLPSWLKQHSYVVSDKTAEQLTSEVKQIIKDLQRWGDELFELTMENRGLRTLIQHMNRMLPNPLIVFDTSYKILGYSSNLDVARDKAWQRSLQSGYVALSDDQFVGMKTMILSTHNLPDETIYDFPQFENRFFHANILYSNRNLAHFTIIEQVCEISAGQISLAAYICAILSIELQKKEMSIFTTDKFYEYLFKEMIGNPAMSRSEIKDRLHYIQPVWKDYMFVLCMDLKHYSRKDKEVISMELPHMIKVSKNFEHGDSLVVLLEKKNNSPFTAEEKREFTDFLQSKSLSAGLSDEFTGIEDFAKAHQQAVKAYTLLGTGKEGGLFYYTDARLKDLLERVALIEQVEQLYYQPLVRLIEDSDPAFVNTLAVYIDNLSNQKVTAQVLGIHRTTLIYRIHKIEEKLKINLSDADTLFYIKLTLMLLRIKGGLPDHSG